MKHGSFRATCFMLMMACIAVLSAFGDENTVALETKILETFNNDGGSNYDWRLEASKFAYVPKTDKQKEQDGEEPFPRKAFVPAWPVAYHGSVPKDSEGNPKELQSLGIWGRFTRPGYNWIDVFPVEAGADDEAPATVIPVPGRIQYLDMWVWGSNLRYTLEAYFRDYNGVIHVINMGSINHAGWKNLRARVPVSVPQSKTVLPRLAALEFLKFRIWTEPTEQVGKDFYIYFNQFKILTDGFETPYDGDNLANREQVQEFWKGGN